MIQPLDKNGLVIMPGMKVRLCGTHADYMSGATLLVRYMKGTQLALWDGHSFVSVLSNLRNGDTNYHSVEIV
jgi:hypothetical protein